MFVDNILCLYMEDLLSREIFSKVQEVVREIITEKKCEKVTGSEFYENLLSKFGFFTGILIGLHRPLIEETFNAKITSMRSEPQFLKDLCVSDSNENININKFIVFFIRGNSGLEKSWKTYIDSIPKGGRRKTRTHNNKKTKKRKRMKYK